MRVALDISPIEGTASLQHRVRGTGFYTKNLKEALLKYDKKNSYTFFSRGQVVPNADITHYPYFEPFFLSLPFFHSQKTVVTVHDLTPLVFPNNFPSGIKGKIKWNIQKTALQKANAIIADSESSKKDIVKFTNIPQEKIFVVYLAAGNEFKKVQISEKKKKELYKKYNLPEKFCLYVGDITWNKNLPRIISAATEVKIPLVLVGKALVQEDYDKTNPWNSDRNKVFELIKNNPYIYRTGFVTDEDLVMLYNLAIASVMPSLYEGFGLPVLEAMSCGSPVITSKEGSLPEVAGEAALYVDAYDSNSIANGMKTFFNDSEMQKRFAEKGLKQAQQFLWEKTAKETIAVYEKAYSNNY
ncbi:MAG TPA: glycosyltransferase family 1 protein [Patescibacteria group bacterium]